VQRENVLRPSPAISEALSYCLKCGDKLTYFT